MTRSTAVRRVLDACRRAMDAAGHDAREGQRVKILGGMKEFIGKTGRIQYKEGDLYRVRLDNPVEVPGVGRVDSDLWEGSLLRKVGDRATRDEVREGDRVFMPFFRTTSGAPSRYGVKGTVVKVEGARVTIKNDEGRTFTGGIETVEHSRDAAPTLVELEHAVAQARREGNKEKEAKARSELQRWWSPTGWTASGDARDDEEYKAGYTFKVERVPAGGFEITTPDGKVLRARTAMEKQAAIAREVERLRGPGSHDLSREEQEAEARFLEKYRHLGKTGDADTQASIIQVDSATFKIWVKGEAAARPEVFSTREKARAFARTLGLAVDAASPRNRGDALASVRDALRTLQNRGRDADPDDEVRDLVAMISALERSGHDPARLAKLKSRLAALRGRDAGPRIVYNGLLGGWYVVTGPHQTPLNGRFDSKAEAQAWLDRRRGHDAVKAVVVLQGGEWFYRKAGDVLRYGPYKSASEAAAAARHAGLSVDQALTTGDSARDALRSLAGRLARDTDPSPGDRVTLGPGVRHSEFRGKAGVVRRVIKSRGVVEVKLDDGRLYDANPENIQSV